MERKTLRSKETCSQVLNEAFSDFIEMLKGVEKIEISDLERAKGVVIRDFLEKKYRSKARFQGEKPKSENQGQDENQGEKPKEEKKSENQGQDGKKDENQGEKPKEEKKSENQGQDGKKDENQGEKPKKSENQGQDGKKDENQGEKPKEEKKSENQGEKPKEDNFCSFRDHFHRSCPEKAVPGFIWCAKHRSIHPEQCSGTTKRGVRCSRICSGGNKFCYQHQSTPPSPKPKPPPEPKSQQKSGPPPNSKNNFNDFFQSFFGRGFPPPPPPGAGIFTSIPETIHLAALGLKPGATDMEIKKAYRKTALLVHPDKGGSTEKFKELNESYTFLKELRKFT